jgi:hypothetical protein
MPLTRAARNGAQAPPCIRSARRQPGLAHDHGNSAAYMLPNFHESKILAIMAPPARTARHEALGGIKFTLSQRYFALRDHAVRSFSRRPEFTC